MGVDIVPEGLVNLGLAVLCQGDYDRAKASLEEALVMSQKAGMKATITNALEGMASLAEAMGEATRAAYLWGAAQASREVTGIALPPGDRALHEPYLDAARSRLEKEAWEEALAEGRALSLDQAAEYALAREQESATLTSPAPEKLATDQPPVVLTAREKEVALLMAKDLTNRQIASELTLSEHTVATHVRNILKKLGLYSRNQIAEWFIEHRPLP